jgi:uncharacterized protein with FMN-binding domain
MDNQKNITAIAGGIVALFVIILVGYFLLTQDTTNDEDVQVDEVAEFREIDTTQSSTEQDTTPATDTEQSDQTTSEDQTDDETSQTSTYRDGVYTASGLYSSPASQNEEVVVEITLQDDIIEDVVVTGNTESPTSRNFQELFADGVAQEVVGKDIDSVSTSRINGSSLTSAGFNQALETIKNTAQL